MVRALTCWQVSGNICLSLDEEINGFFLISWCSLLSVLGVVALGLPDLCFDVSSPSSWLRFFVRETADCDIFNFLATSVCDKPSLSSANAIPLFFGDNSHFLPILPQRET